MQFILETAFAASASSKFKFRVPFAAFFRELSYAIDIEMG